MSARAAAMRICTAWGRRRAKPSTVALAVGLPVAGMTLLGSGRLRGETTACLEKYMGCYSGGGTALRFGLCGKPETFTPVFDPKPTRNTASVNAGDYQLYVGGGGINKAFMNALNLDAENGYQAIHEAMLKQAVAQPGRLVRSKMGQELGLENCYARVPNAVSGPVGAAFIDVFTPEHRPLSKRNVAMLYVVGPKGEGVDRDIFLQAVRDTAANAISTVCEYNRLALASTPPLPDIVVVRWCLVSGGIYKHPSTSKLDVATATIEGMLSSADTVGPTTQGVPLVKFTYDEHAFEDAVDQVLSLV